MRLNKQAPWGPLPPAATTTVPSSNSLRHVLGQSPLQAKFDDLKVAITATDNKAALGKLTAALQPLAQLPTALTGLRDSSAKQLGQLKASLDALTAAVQQHGGVTLPRTPSALALRLLGRLSQLRDALCDSESPEKTANGRLTQERNADSTRQLCELLEQRYPDLTEDFMSQFRNLDSQGAALDAERRQRLAELMLFEWRIVAVVDDPAPSSQ